MKGFALITCFFSVILLPNARAIQSRPHWDLEMTSKEYRDYFKRFPSKLKNKFKHGMSENSNEPSIEQALAIGDRLSHWIAAENSRRSEAQAIRLTSSAQLRVAAEFL